MHECSGPDYVVACVIATEVPPVPTGSFTEAMIDPAIQAVAQVIRNRAADPRFPNTPVEVVLAPRQFSAVCSQDYWRRAMAGKWEPSHVDRCIAGWCGLTGSLLTDFPALWYYSPYSMVPKDSAPSWAATRTEVLVPGIDREYFRFFKD